MELITVKVTDFKNMVDELIKDKADYVEVTILEAEEYLDEVVPKVLHFESYGINGSFDYEGIEEVIRTPNNKAN